MMETTRKDKDQHLKGIDREREELKKATTGGRVVSTPHVDAVIKAAGLLVVVGLALSNVKILDEQRARTLKAGSISAASGVFTGHLMT